MSNAAKKPDVIDIRQPGEVEPISAHVSDLPVVLKKIATTDEGKLSITLDSEMLDEEHLSQVRDMLALQRSGVVLVSIDPAQRGLFDD